MNTENRSPYLHQRLREVAYHEAAHAVVMVAATGEAFDFVEVLDTDCNGGTAIHGHLHHRGGGPEGRIAIMGIEMPEVVREALTVRIYAWTLLILAGPASEMLLDDLDFDVHVEFDEADISIWELLQEMRAEKAGIGPTYDVAYARTYLEHIGVSMLAAFEDALSLVRAPDVWLGVERLAERLIVDRELNYDEVMAIPEVASLHLVARDRVRDRLQIRVLQES